MNKLYRHRLIIDMVSENEDEEIHGTFDLRQILALDEELVRCSSSECVETTMDDAVDFAFLCGSMPYFFTHEEDKEYVYPGAQEFEIDIEFKVKATTRIIAASREEALKIAQDECWVMLESRDSDRMAEEVKDFKYDLHPDREVIRVCAVYPDYHSGHVVYIKDVAGEIEACVNVNEHGAARYYYRVSDDIICEFTNFFEVGEPYKHLFDEFFEQWEIVGEVDYGNKPPYMADKVMRIEK